MILRISKIIATLLVTVASGGGSHPSSFSLAFQSSSSRPSTSQCYHSIPASSHCYQHSIHGRSSSVSASVPAAAALRMSSIPDDNDNNDKDNNSNNPLFSLEHQFWSKLPPAPEDQIALSGDILALFTYTYLDHTVNQLYADTAAKMDIADLVTYDPSIAAANPLPVWFDAARYLHTFGENWLSRTQIEVPYAPALAASGLAFVSIASCWLVCGYFTGAFLTRNTLECSASKAMVVTLQTWMGMALLMVLLALGSDALWGQLDTINALSAPARGGLTNADADYIFDSLTVLAFWRFMFNWLLGYK